jgi:hypothetical protein
MKDRLVDSFVIFNTRLCIAVLCVHLHDVIKCMFLLILVATIYEYVDAFTGESCYLEVYGTVAKFRVIQNST